MIRKTKALLLSAGFGTRLKPLTINKPKCLIEVNGIPMIEHWLKKLEELGIDEVLINTHYLSFKVEEYILNRAKSKLKIFLAHEEELLGTAGTLIHNKNFFKGSTIIFIHTDNFTTSSLKGLFNTFMKKPKRCKLTMLTFLTENPHSCGIVTLRNNIVKEFHEKVLNPPGNIANGAIYLFDYELINWIEKNISEPFDFSLDVLPLLLDKINTWPIDQEYIDIGTHQTLKKANNLFKNN